MLGHRTLLLQLLLVERNPNPNPTPGLCSIKGLGACWAIARYLSSYYWSRETLTLTQPQAYVALRD
jgi:hypothetical protein